MPVPYLPWMQPIPPTDAVMTPPTPPAPFQPKPSIFDRLIARLYPTSQMLSPELGQQVGRQALTQLGANLLYAGGASPQNRGTLSNIGAAIGGVDTERLIENALALQAYKQQQATSQEIGHIIAGEGPTANEKPEDTRARLLRIAGKLSAIPEAQGIVKEMLGVAEGLKPPAPLAAHWTTTTRNVNGKNIVYRTNLATGEEYPLGLAPVTEKPPKEPTPPERVAASQYDSAAQSVRNMEDIATRNPNAAKAAVAAIRAGGWGKLGQVYSELRGYTNDPDAQQFYTEFNNALLSFSPIYGGTRTTQQILTLEKAAVLPALGSGDFASAFAHLHSRLHDLQAKAGKAMTSAASGGAIPVQPDNPWRH